MLDFKALESAFSIIRDVGQGEITFMVDQTPVTMRVLTTDEDLDVQTYARGNDAGEDEDSSQPMRVLERFKRATLAYAIVQVGSLDLRNEQYVATGDVNENGVPIKMRKHVAIRKLLDTWSRVTTLALFQKYSELVNRVDAKAEQAIRFDIEDLDVEINRVEKRLEGLKQERENLQGRKSASEVVSNLADLDKQSVKRQTQVMQEVAQKSPTPPPTEVHQEPVTPAPPPQVRRPITADVVQSAPPPQVRPAPAAAAPPPPSTFDDLGSSLGDTEDDLAAEHARLMAARSRRQALSDITTPDVVPTPVGVRQPPHIPAAETAQALPTPDGAEAFRLDPVHLTERGRQPVNPNTRVPVNPTIARQPTNPRFSPPKK
jgi:hypothetical protein